MEQQPFGNIVAWRTVERWLAEQTAPERATGGESLGYGSVLFILGNSGTGKTHLVRSLCDAHDYDLQILHSQNCENARTLSDRLTKMTRTRLVQTLTGTPRPVVVLIDELDTLIQMDRMMLSTLTDLVQNGRLPHVALIAIGAPAQEKKLGAFKNAGCPIIQCYPPSDADLFLFLKARAATAGAAAPSAKRLMDIAETAAGNFHAACRMLDDGDADEPTPVTVSLAPPKFQMVFQADRNGGGDGGGGVLRIFSEDPWLAPLRFHENLIKEFNNRKGLIRDKLRVYRGIVRALCDWDQWMAPSGGGTNAFEEIADADDGSGGGGGGGGALDACRVLSGFVVHYLSQLPRKKNVSVAERDLQDFTRVFSQISIYKKQERAIYRGQTDAFPWADAQIFYHV